MDRTRRIFSIVFLTSVLFSSPAGAEDLWEISEGAETWEDLWDEGELLDPGEWTLSILGGHREGGRNSLDPARAFRDSEFRGETYAMATLSLPLDGIFGSRETLPTPPEGEISSGSGTGSSSAGSERLALLEDSPPADAEPVELGQGRSSSEVRATVVENRDSISQKIQPAGRGGLKPKPRDSTVGEAKRLLAVVTELSHRVRIGSGLQGADLRLQQLARRARLSGLAPELRLRGVYGFDQTTSLEDAEALIPGETTTRGGRDSLAEVRLTFHLERLLFGSQDLTIERQKLQSQAEKRKIEALSVDLFFDWKAADRRARDPDLFDEELMEAQVRAETALAHLHLLTKGWFRGWPTLGEFGMKPPSRPSKEVAEIPLRGSPAEPEERIVPVLPKR